MKTTCCGAGAVYPFLTVKREAEKEGGELERWRDGRKDGRKKISKVVRLSRASPQSLPFLFGTLEV